MTKAQTLRAKMQAVTEKMSTEQIVDCVRMLADCDDIDRVVARVALLNEYERREGWTAVDALMDSVGL